MQRIEVFSGSGRRRRWSGGQKALIFAETFVTGETVSAVADAAATVVYLAAGSAAARAGASRMAFAPVVLETARSCAGAEPVGRGQSVGSLAIEIIIGAATVRVPPGTERGFAARFARADDHAVMITIPSGVRVLVATKPVDFRKGGEGLAALVRAALGERSILGDAVRFPQKTCRPDQNFGLGRLRPGAILETAGTRSIPLAADLRRDDAVERLAACRPD